VEATSFKHIGTVEHDSTVYIRHNSLGYSIFKTLPAKSPNSKSPEETESTRETLPNEFYEKGAPVIITSLPPSTHLHLLFLCFLPSGCASSGIQLLLTLRQFIVGFCCVVDGVLVYLGLLRGRREAQEGGGRQRREAKRGVKGREGGEVEGGWDRRARM